MILHWARAPSANSNAAYENVLAIESPIHDLCQAAIGIPLRFLPRIGFRGHGILLPSVENWRRQAPKRYAAFPFPPSPTWAIALCSALDASFALAPVWNLITFSLKMVLSGGDAMNSTLKIQTSETRTLIEKIKAEIRKRAEAKAKRMLLKAPKKQMKRTAT